MSSIYPEGGAGGGLQSQTTGSDPLKSQVSQAREKLAETGEAVRGEAAHFAERAREEVVRTVETKTESVTGALDVFADAVRKAGEELGAQDQSMAAKLAMNAADGLQTFSRNLGGKSAEEMLHSLRDLGRNNPTVFLAGAVVAGLAIGRFARSSAAHETGPDSGAVMNPYAAETAYTPPSQPIASGASADFGRQGEPGLRTGDTPYEGEA